MIPIKSVKRFEALTLTSLEKNGLEFFTNFFPKSLSIFTPKNRGFLGVKPGPLESPIIQLMAHQKILGGYYLKKLNIQLTCEKSDFFLTMKWSKIAIL
jgi:hypothetical protein